MNISLIPSRSITEGERKTADQLEKETIKQINKQTKQNKTKKYLTFRKQNLSFSLVIRARLVHNGATSWLWVSHGGRRTTDITVISKWFKINPLGVQHPKDNTHTRARGSWEILDGVTFLIFSYPRLSDTMFPSKRLKLYGTPLPHPHINLENKV